MVVNSYFYLTEDLELDNIAQVISTIKNITIQNTPSLPFCYMYHSMFEIALKLKWHVNVRFRWKNNSSQNAHFRFSNFLDKLRPIALLSVFFSSFSGRVDLFLLVIFSIGRSKLVSGHRGRSNFHHVVV